MENEKSRRKRTNKASSPSLRSLQAREGENGVQAETKPMPQPEGEAVAKTNRANTEIGGKMYSFKDRLIDWVERRGTWTRILLAVGIALIITVIILAVAMPGKSATNANAVEIGGLKTTIGAVADVLGTKASQTELNSWGQNITQALSAQVLDIIGLRARVKTAEDKLKDGRDDITAIQGSLAELLNKAYLTGIFKNYILHAKSSEAGNFTANIHLVYSAPLYVGNTTTHDETLSAFYAGVNWTASATMPAYIPVATSNGTVWGISEIWWNIGTFELTANNEKVIGATCAGLNSTWEPSFAYVEVWLIVK